MSASEDMPPTAVDPPGTLKRLARRFEFDRAVFYALAARGWQTISGPITILLIATFFSKELQGYYYAFGSLLAFQTLFELNLSVVLLNAAAHEWTRLRLTEGGRVTGDPEALARLAALVRFGRRWYSAVAAVCWFSIGGVGLWMFRDLGMGGLAAWAATVSAAAMSLWCLPRLEVLRGCHQVEAVNRTGAAQAVSGSLVTWACVPSGTGLWAVAASWWAKVAWELWLSQRRFRRFFRSLRGRPNVPIRWGAEVWPLQWRLAVQAVAATTAFASFNLSLFHLRSPEEAGRMGMTWSTLNMLLWAGLAWVQTRVPTLAGHARRNDRAAYDRLFVRVTIPTVAAVAAGAVTFWGAVAALHLILPAIAERFVGLWAFGLLAAGVVMQHAMGCLTGYARTRRRESFFVPNVVFNTALTAGIWLSAGRFGETGVAAVYAGLTAGLGMPMWVGVWMRERGRWRKE